MTGVQTCALPISYGAARGMKDFIMITLGTGVGSGIVINGQLVYGHDGFAGELGHVIVRRDGRQCGCGRKGCLETYCSATGVARTAREFLVADGASARPASMLAVAQAIAVTIIGMRHGQNHIQANKRANRKER